MGHHAGHAVDHAQGHQAFFGEWLDIRPQGGEMVGIMDRQQRNAGTAGFLHQQRAGGFERRLGEAVGGVHANKP